MAINHSDFIRIFTLMAFSIFVSVESHAGDLETKMSEIYQNWIPPHTEVGKVKIESVEVNTKKKIVTLSVNEAAIDVSFTQQALDSLKQLLSQALPESQKNYKIQISYKNTPLENYAFLAKKKNPAPKEKKPFVVKTWAHEAPLGLDGANIAVGHSHGWYFESKLNRWEWQRARILETVEDLYPLSYAIPFLMPMLENAGAYVFTPRERDTQITEIIIDNDGLLAEPNGYSENNGKNQWETGDVGFAYAKPILYNGDNPFKMGTFRQVKSTKKEEEQSTATYSANIPQRGDYAVYVSYASLPKSATSVPYTIHSLKGDQTVRINQKMGSGTWIYLGHFPFEAGEQEIVTVSNYTPNENAVVTADAIKIGGGMGNVARSPLEPLDSIDYVPMLSRYPRWVEGSRYWLQWAGMPDSVYSPTEFSNDYVDDYASRGIWVNYLSGGSSMNQKEGGLGIPIDAWLSWHTDAGTTLDDSIIGTLGIYSTDNGHLNGAGASKMLNRDYTDFIMTQIVDDIRNLYEPDWSRRRLWDRSYAEARRPQVPSMLLELLSHQNFADMKYGMDPTFRFTVSRAIYKGMLKFLAYRDGREYVVQPLAIRSFGIQQDSDNAKQYTLSWKETVDSLEPTALPTYYIIEQRVNDGAFKEIATVTDTKWTFNNVIEDSIYSFRIIAANEGGISFPSETLALGLSSKGGETVDIVNGFTRLSAPDWFEAGEIAGFHSVKDHGVPYVQDYNYIGEMFEFRRAIPWMDDDAAGFGASRANFETQIIAGNTFDYPYIHGRAILEAGHSFVSESVEAFVDPLKENGNNRIVDLILGKQKETPIGRGIMGTRYKTFTPELQAALSRHALSGGDILVTGSYVATDLWDNDYSSQETMETDKLFAENILGYTWRVGQASVTGEAYQVPIRFKSFTGGEYFFNPGLNADSYAVESPDSFYATDNTKGATLMRYTENNLVAAVANDKGSYRTVIIGFPFEVIKGESSRNNLMNQILNFFTH